MIRNAVSQFYELCFSAPLMHRKASHIFGKMISICNIKYYEHLKQIYFKNHHSTSHFIKND